MKVKLFKIRIKDEFLHEDQEKLNEFLTQNEVLKHASAYIAEDYCWSVIVYYDTVQNVVKEKSNKKYSATAEPLAPHEELILESLKVWRSEKAREQKLPSYFIATNQELISVAKFKPIKKEELLEIKGFGKHKIENYGEEILEILENI